MKFRFTIHWSWTRTVALIACLTMPSAHGASFSKVEDVIVYSDPKFYSAFPSIIRLPEGELVVAFRRAPDRRKFGEGVSHTDPNSYLVSVRSRDKGRTWSREPDLMFAHPFGGAQDPCMVSLRDGTVICTSYAWASLQPAAIESLKKPFARHGNFVFLGGFLLRSHDGAKTWGASWQPPPTAGDPNLDIFGSAIPAYNRGAMCEGADGRLYWITAAATTNAPQRTGTHLLISEDVGKTWKYSSPVATDPKIEFNETSVYETAKGDLVAFIRTENYEDQTVIARSSDRGKTFQWKGAGFKGHPHHAVRLPDDRVLLVYGYRHKPFGIRARLLNSECTDAATAEEIVLRDDGGNGDLGYPWATVLSPKEALVVYYFNRGDGVREIAGTFVNFGQ